MELPGEVYLFNLSILAITFSAVSALVMLLRQTMGGRLSNFDLHLITAYVSGGFVVALNAILPPLLSLAEPSPAALWGVASGLAAAFLTLFVVGLIKKRRHASNAFSANDGRDRLDMPRDCHFVAYRERPRSDGAGCLVVCGGPHFVFGDRNVVFRPPDWVASRRKAGRGLGPGTGLMPRSWAPAASAAVFTRRSVGLRRWPDLAPSPPRVVDRKRSEADVAPAPARVNKRGAKAAAPRAPGSTTKPVTRRSKSP